MNKRFWHVKPQAVEPVRLELRSTHALKQLEASIETFPEDYSDTTKLRCAKELARRERVANPEEPDPRYDTCDQGSI